jgi:hypothetical protein
VPRTVDHIAQAKQIALIDERLDASRTHQAHQQVDAVGTDVHGRADA